MPLSFKDDSENMIKVEGELDYKNVVCAKKAACAYIKSQQTPVFDLGGLILSDNAGLVFLTSLTRYAESKQKTIRFVNLPVKLYDMIKLSSLEQLLPI